MTRHRNGPRPTARHIAALSRLVKRAQVAAKHPECPRKAYALTVEAERAAKAVLPIGHQNDTAGPLVQLIRLSKAWLANAGRADTAPMLQDLATQSRQILDSTPIGEAKS